MDPDTSSEKSERLPGGAVGTGAQGLCTLPSPAWLIQVSKAGKVEPGVQGPMEDRLPEASPRGLSPPWDHCLQTRSHRGRTRRSPSRGPEGRQPCPSLFLHVTSSAPDRLSAGHVIGEESVVFTEGRVCPFLPSPRAVPVSLPRSRVGSQSRATLHHPPTSFQTSPEPPDPVQGFLPSSRLVGPQNQTYLERSWCQFEEHC